MAPSPDAPTKMQNAEAVIITASNIAVNLLNLSIKKHHLSLDYI
jgi:hypothetical protein